MPPTSEKKRKSSRSKPDLPNTRRIERNLRKYFPNRLPANLPRHVAIIMDGNGRWAQERGLPRVEGHRRGAKSVAAVVAISREIGIDYLTLYAFSSENWRRPRLEVNSLMHLLDEYLSGELSEMLEHGIRLKAIGDLSRLPRAVRIHLEQVVRRTSEGRGMTLVLALSYGGRSEIVHMVRQAAEDARVGILDPARIDERYVSDHLYTAGIPDPDLLVRTAGEYRLSNFLLWQTAYTELYVTKKLWPQFRRAEYVKALLAYADRERRYGMTHEQVTAQRKKK